MAPCTFIGKSLRGPSSMSFTYGSEAQMYIASLCHYIERPHTSNPRFVIGVTWQALLRERGLSSYILKIRDQGLSDTYSHRLSTGFKKFVVLVVQVYR